MGGHRSVVDPSCFNPVVPACAGRARRPAGGGDDGSAEPAQAVLREELAHPGLRRPQRDGAPRGAGLALQAAGGCGGPGRGLASSHTCSRQPTGDELFLLHLKAADQFDSTLSSDSCYCPRHQQLTPPNQNHRYSPSFPCTPPTSDKCSCSCTDPVIY